MHLSGLDCGWRYLYLLNDGLELRRTIRPLFQQLHGLVEILHVLCVHLEEGCEFLQDVSDARRGRPAGKERRRQGLLDLKLLLQRSGALLSAQRENVNAAECFDSELSAAFIHISFPLMLTILPCVSPGPEAETGCGRCGWRRCWRRCSSPPPQGTSLYLPPPLA